MSSTAEIMEFARDMKRPRNDMWENCIWPESITVGDKELYFFQAVHQESIVVPENVDAIRAMHLKYKYHRSLEEMLGCAKETIEYATDHGLKVRFAAEDASRTPIDRLKQAFKEVENEYKVQYVSLADTIGILNPTTTHYLVSEIFKEVNTSICIHCHAT